MAYAGERHSECDLHPIFGRGRLAVWPRVMTSAETNQTVLRFILLQLLSTLPADVQRSCNPSSRGPLAKLRPGYSGAFPSPISFTSAAASSRPFVRLQRPVSSSSFPNA